MSGPSKMRDVRNSFRTRWLLSSLVVAGVVAMVSLRTQAMPVTSPSPDTSAGPRPVLLELFTSQSCSSCPPADAYLGELAQRSDVLPLSFHVDYWNGLGWHDRFSSAQFTERQRRYSEQLRASVYTPQLVIDGAREAVGSDHEAIEHAIRSSARDLRASGMRIERQGKSLLVQRDDPAPGDAELLLVTFDPIVSQSIRGGENSGRTVTYHNVVRSLRVLNLPAEKRVTAMLNDDETGARIALIEQAPSGRILDVAADR